MAHTYLLEIGLEEMPAHVVTPSMKQLVQRTESFLKEQRLDYDQVIPFSTPRRLTVQITGLADKQTDIDESVKGPAKKIAQDADGNWTKAAIGFSKGQGMTPDDIIFKELKGTEYVFLNKHIEGQPAAKVLPEIKDVILSMTFPTRMKWNVYNLEYIRPIRWLVSLLDDEIVPLQILDVKAGRQTRGHRVLGHSIELANASDYQKALYDQYVIVDAVERKALIQKQIDQIAQQHDWDIKVDAGLLEEVNNLVEWPTVFAGKFDPKFLTIPSEVLITSMRDNQRYFYVEDHDGQLLPYFIGVRNGTDYKIDNVISGNEKVLTARLDDAMFFYQEDTKHSIDYFVERLKNVSFHDKISTEYEKMQRVRLMTQIIGKQIGFDDQQLTDVDRAAQIYKFDLVTEMVGEFAELQGVMGEKYALLKGEKPDVARAIREHYMPITSDGQLPQSKIGAVLAIADKFDSIMTFFAAGMIPSGSNDPYALRRQAIGIVRIVANQNWDLPLQPTMDSLIQSEEEHHVAPKLDQQKIVPDVIEFIKDRITTELHDQNIDYDVIDTVKVSQNANITFIINAAQVLQKDKNTPDFKAEIEELTRVSRIAVKADFAADDLDVDASLFENDSEQQLFDAVTKITPDYYDQTASETLTRLLTLAEPIKNYFDATMVMAKDEKIRNNHLRQMTVIANMIKWFGDLDQLIVK